MNAHTLEKWSYRFLTLSTALLPALGLFAPLAMAPLVVLMGLAALGGTWSQRPWRLVPRGFVLMIGLVTVWGAISAPVAVDPLHSVRTAFAFLGLAVSGLALRSGWSLLAHDRRQRLIFVLWGSLAVTIAVLVADLLTCGAIVAMPFHGLDLCDPGHRFVHKRGFTVLCLIVMAALATLPSTRLRLVLAVALFLGLVAVANYLGANTLMTGLFAGISVALLVRLTGRWAMRALSAAFALLVIVVPLACTFIPEPGSWQEGERALPPSLHHRLTIWHFAAGKWIEKPMWGWGMDSSRSIPGGEDIHLFSMVRAEDGLVFVNKEQLMPLHPHNGVLQWWLELGLPGGVLLIGIGVALLRAIGGLSDGGSKAYAVTVATTVIVVALGSFGAWQSWWIGTLWIVGALMAAPARYGEDERPDILFLTENFPPETNAAATRVYERALYWARWGHRVTVITCFPNFPLGKVFEGYPDGWYKVEEMEGLKVVRVKTFIAANEGFAKRTLDFLSFMVTGVAAGLRQPKPNLVVATSPQFFAAVAGWLLGFLRGVPFVFELGDLWPRSILAVGAMRQSLAIRLLERLELFLYRQSACVVALTHAFKDDLTRRGIDPDKIAVVINGVDLPRYEPRPRDVELARDWGLEGKFVVGYVGTHGMAHGLINVLDAAERMRGDDRLRFLLVGAGAERQMLLDEAARRGLANVVFQPLQPKAMMPRIWSLCDVALVHLKDDLAFAEVIPSKIFEAMGMGLPILLVAPEGEASRIVIDDGAGLWVPAGRPQDLAEAVARLAADEDGRVALAARSLASAPLHSRERQARQMIAVLDAVARGKGAQAACYAA